MTISNQKNILSELIDQLNQKIKHGPFTWVELHNDTSTLLLQNLKNKGVIYHYSKNDVGYSICVTQADEPSPGWCKMSEKIFKIGNFELQK